MAAGLGALDDERARARFDGARAPPPGCVTVTHDSGKRASTSGAGQPNVNETTAGGVGLEQRELRVPVVVVRPRRADLQALGLRGRST